MRQALHDLFSELLDAIWRGVTYGTTAAIALLIAFGTLKYVCTFIKATQLWGGQ
jgi:hypothetical protein